MGPGRDALAISQDYGAKPPDFASMDLAGPARVHRSRRARRFVTLRRHAIAKLSALFLLALILTPFTAPFATYQLSQSADSHPFDTPAKAKSVADEKLEGALKCIDVVGQGQRRRPDRSRPPAPVAEHRIRHTVLRLCSSPPTGHELADCRRNCRCERSIARADPRRSGAGACAPASSARTTLERINC